MAATGSTELPKEAALYWIHCNRCFEIYTQKKRRIFILACQHLSCDSCMRTTNDKNLFICSICNKTVRVRLLGNVLPPHIKELFHPEPWLDGLPTMHILNFQQKHMQNFLQGVRRMSRELSILKQSIDDAKASARANFEALETKRHERKSLERRVHKVVQRRKQIEEENAQREVALRSLPRAPSSTTDESRIGRESHTYRPRYPQTSHNPAFSRDANVLEVTGPRMLSPNSALASFSNFAFRQRQNSFQL